MKQEVMPPLPVKPPTGAAMLSTGKRAPRPRNFDKSRALSIKTRNADDPAYVAYAIHKGIPFSRKLTRQERIAIAVGLCMPTYHLTVTSSLTRDELMRVFRAFKSRRRRDGRGSWIYVGNCVMSTTGDAGYHMHLLLWESMHVNSLNDDLAGLGAGKAYITKIEPSAGIGPLANVLDVTAYVLGQEESVFGRDNYLENIPRPPSKRALLMPQRKTLQERKPELLLALDRAKDPAVPDDAVYRPLH